MEPTELTTKEQLTIAVDQLLAKLSQAKEAAGRSEQGRHLSVLFTDAEKLRAYLWAYIQ